MNLNDLKEYELLKNEKLLDINADGYLLKHKKSGAHVFLISNDDENKVFTIGFRTPPNDSTGLPHILEHSVLCGSKLFPAKDPFVELVKGSLNTFLNAMTYPDKTLYPVASCNEKDFKNLMHVYMDAVFFTNIYEKEEIFRQEGWHYEIEDEESDLTINGVVYNEMKGAFSSPEDVLDREILNSLFPDTVYSHESGGSPDKIPDLLYSDFLKFHSRYYHPSNSYIYLYGDMDMEERLNWLDKEYLSQYDVMNIDSAIALQSSFDMPVEVHDKYSISSSESEDNNTYLSYNTVIGTGLQKELTYAFQVLEYALIAAPGAPVKQALLDKKIGKDIMSSYNNGILQPVFSIIAKNAEASQKEEFLKTIKDTLTDLVKNKINRNAIRAGINYYEFKYKEADFGSYPKGLIYGLQAFDSWLYDSNEPFLYMESNEAFAFLKNQLDTGYFEDLVDKYLIQNTHASYVIIEPEKGLTAKMDRELEEKLKKYKESLSKEEIKTLVEQTHNLRKYQEEPTPVEDLQKIPMLTREDIKKEPEPFYNTEHVKNDTLILHHNLFTNGIGYVTLMFNTEKVPQEWIPYMALLKYVLVFMDTDQFSYAELFNEINIKTGGISSSLNIYTDYKAKDSYKVNFEIGSKVLYDNLGIAFDLIKNIILTTKFEDEKRLYEILAQLKSRLEMNMNGSGHSTAAMRSMSYFSKAAYFTDLISGVSFYRFIADIESDFENKKETVIQTLKKITTLLFQPHNLMIDYTANDEGLLLLENEIERFKKDLYADTVEKYVYQFALEKKNEAFKTSSKVQYVSQAGNFVSKGFTYNGVLKILKVILSYDYLWLNIRVKGGAYGCMNGFSRNGDSYFTSYRDPNLEKTIAIYEKVPEYVKGFDVDDRDMTKYIIGTISDIDVPLNPNAKGKRSLSAYLSHLDFEEVKKERDQILHSNQQSVRDLYEMIQSLLSDKCICVIGNEEKMEEQKQLFMNVENLIQ